MNKNTIRDYFFILSGYWNISVDFIRKKTQPCLVVLAILTGRTLIAGIINSTIQNIVTHNYYNQILPMVGLYIVLLITSFLSNLYTIGIIYTQIRSYIDNYSFTVSDSIRYTNHKIISFVTTTLFLFFVYFCIAVFSIIFVVLLAIIIPAVMSNANGLIGYMLLDLFVFLLSVGIITLFILLMIKWYFSPLIAIHYGLGGTRSVDYSDKLTKGMKGKLLGYLMMFVGIICGVSIIPSIIYAITANYILLLMIQGILILPISLFQLIYFNMVYINVESVKQKHFGYYQLQPTPDPFIVYCTENNIPREQPPDYFM